MYAALWRILPGPVWLRVVLSVILVVAVVALLALVIYPWVAVVLNGDLGSTVQ